MSQTRWRQALMVTGVVLIVGVLLIDLARTPTPWWDEGWTMLVARNWIEHGHYGRCLSGVPVAHGLSAAFPTVASIALSFKLLGVGIVQARLPILIYTLAGLVVLYRLAGRLYDRSTAVAALLIAVLLAPQRYLQPLFIGRQVLAEMPMLFYLLAGYASLMYALRRGTVGTLVTIGLWTIALTTKAQAVPFWLASVVATVGLAWWMKERRLSIRIGLMAAGTLLGYVVVLRLFQWVLPAYADESDITRSLYSVTALMLDPNVRLYSLSQLTLVGLPLVLGLLYAIRQQFRSIARLEAGPDQVLTRFALLALAGSWTLWYVTLSNGWILYLFPAVFIGAIFTAVMLRDATRHFDFAASLGEAARDLRRRRFTRLTVKALAAAILVALMVPFSAMALYLTFLPGDGTSVLEVADYLNHHTPPAALIESYESEVLFLLDRPYHFPPDQYHVDKIRGTLFFDSTPVEYDPLTAGPDYIVTGTYAQMWDIYTATLAAGKFQQVYANAQYQVYARTR